MKKSSAALLAISLLALTGCTAEVKSSIEVTGESTATITVSAVFTDEAAAAFNDNIQSRQELNNLFESRDANTPEVSITDDRVVASSEMSYENFIASSDITGIDSFALTDEGQKLTIKYSDAQKLVEVITEQNATEPDAAALTATMLDNTYLVLEVVYPGGVKSVSDAFGEVEKADTSVTFTRLASQTEAGEFVVEGNPTGFDWALWGPIAGGSVALIGIVLYQRSRRNSI